MWVDCLLGGACAGRGVGKGDQRILADKLIRQHSKCSMYIVIEVNSLPGCIHALCVSNCQQYCHRVVYGICVFMCWTRVNAVGAISKFPMIEQFAWRC